MDRITEGLFIGGMAEALDFQRLQEAGVEAMLQLYGHERERIPFPIPVDVLQVPVRDRESLPEGMLREGVAFIRGHREAGRTVLVTCGAGISRSPCFIAAYLHETGWDLLAALQAVQERRPHIRPHRALVTSLVEFYGLDVEPADLLAELARSRRALPGETE